MALHLTALAVLLPGEGDGGPKDWLDSEVNIFSTVFASPNGFHIPFAYIILRLYVNDILKTSNNIN